MRTIVGKLIFCLLLVVINIRAQVSADSSLSFAKNRPDTIRAEKKKKWVFDSQIDQRNSFITIGKTSSSLPIYGYSVGWTRKGRIRIGGGAYYASSNSSHGYLVKATSDLQALTPYSVVVNVKSNNYYMVQKKTVMFYFTPSFEWIFFKSKWLDLSIPIEVGLGYSKISLSDYFSGAPIPIYNYRSHKVLPGNIVFVPALAGLSAMFNLTPDVGFEVGAGYRYILQEVGLSQDFDGWYYQLGAQLYPANFLKSFKQDYRAWKEKRRKRKLERRINKNSK